MRLLNPPSHVTDHLQRTRLKSENKPRQNQAGGIVQFKCSQRGPGPVPLERGQPEESHSSSRCLSLRSDSCQRTWNVWWAVLQWCIYSRCSITCRGSERNSRPAPLPTPPVRTGLPSPRSCVLCCPSCS